MTADSGIWGLVLRGLLSFVLSGLLIWFVIVTIRTICVELGKLSQWRTEMIAKGKAARRDDAEESY